MDASFVPKSGKKTYGLDRCWNGSHSRTETGLEIWRWPGSRSQVTAPTASASIRHPQLARSDHAEVTRIDGYLEPLTRVVSAHALGFLHDVVTDGYDSQQQCIGGVRFSRAPSDWGCDELMPIGAISTKGPKCPGPGRPKTYAGKVNWNDRSRLEKVDPEDDQMVLYHQLLNPVQCQCNLLCRGRGGHATQPACGALRHRCGARRTHR